MKVDEGLIDDCTVAAGRNCAAWITGLAVLFLPLISDAADLDAWLSDTGAYFTAPVHWDKRDWLEFGSTVAVIAAAHEYDGSMRAHFAAAPPADLQKPSHELRDTLPAVALVAGSWVLSKIQDDPKFTGAAWDMVEAGALSTATAFVLKTATGRERPYDTRQVDSWRNGGDSFPSIHATAAFAVGTVFAESGGDEYRWVKRIIGYGMAGATAYIRVHDNDHWLSDVVAGAALGEATARFIVHRHSAVSASTAQLYVVPTNGGIALQFVSQLR